MPDFFDYGIADEVHELKGDTAQGNALGTLARSVDRIAVLTGTLMGGYADDLFNVLYRLEPHKMVTEGYEWGESGVRNFAESYGVLERVTIIPPEENACSKAKVTKQVKRKPGASPLLFGKFLMELGAFVSLEDISSELPAYREEVIGVDMDEPLAKAYADLEKQIKEALEEHRGNHSVISTALNALLAYPDRPYGFGDLIGTEYDPESHRRVPFLIAQTRDLSEDLAYAKERKLIECIKADLARGRKCQLYAVYTAKRDVTRRLERVLSQEGIRVSVSLLRCLPISARPGTNASSATECKCAWLILAWFLLGWTCFGRPPSISCRRDIRFTLCDRRAAARGGSDSGPTLSCAF